jgi:Flp pilus assembly protein TadG
MSKATAFLSSRKGNVTMLFALATVPLFGFISFAVDYSRATSVHEKMQLAADAAVLAGAALPGTVSAGDVRTLVTNMLNTTAPDRQLRGLTLDVSADAMTVTARISGHIDSSFARIIGVNLLELSSVSKAQRPRTAKADIALVLDNTGSMNSDGKLVGLKAAVSGVGGLTSQLRTAFSARPNDVRISLVPFSVGVRLPAVNAAMASVIKPAVGAGWTGCVADRAGNYDLNNIAPTAADINSFLPRKHPSNATVACPGSTVSALTSNMTQVDTAINAMAAAGNTNATVGLFWGRQSLKQGGILPGGYPSTQADLTRYLILLTDGDNTQSLLWSQSGATANPAPIDDKMLAMCDSIRNVDGYIVYTIGFGTGISTEAKAKLATCAGSPDRAKLATSSGDLNAVFAAIASDVQRTRLLK